ncbi:hypothetical protein ACFFGR_06595 [Arthrobacter liuii]|uniref:hypothetical protein n=1 Tax=Arthrobacter liuii TaxID=1476996 RepID=UPI0035F04F07
MAKELSIEEAVERARRAQEDRITAIRAVAQARQKLADVREATAHELAELQAKIAGRVGEAEREDVRAYNAAVTAGWSPDELRKIGFSEPDKKARARRRAARKTTPTSENRPTPATTPGTPAHVPHPDDLPGVESQTVDA